MSLQKRHLTATVVAVAGCSPVTFRAWRNRNGLFPSTRVAKGWNTFSEADIAAVRMIVLLTRLGLEAQTAVTAAMNCLSAFEKMYDAVRRGKLAMEMNSGSVRNIAVIGIVPKRKSGEPDSPDVVFVSNNVTAGDILIERVACGAAVAIDLAQVIFHVNEEIRTGEYQTLATPSETMHIVAKAFADVIAPGRSKKSPKRKGRK